MIIRAYKDSDLNAVINLWKAVFPDAPAHNIPEDDIRIKLNIQRELFLVAEEKGEIIGTAMAGFDGHRGWVYYLAVSPDHRRKGIGMVLMKTAEEKLTQMGCPKINIMVRATNRSVVQFYEKLGYASEERITMGKLTKGK